jgi:hypothetical protein
VQISALNNQHERDVPPLVPNVEPPLHAPPRPSVFKNDQLANDRPSIGSRIFRALARFFLAVLIGIAVTLAWQSYGNEAKEMLSAWAPSLGWLLPASTKSPSNSTQNAVLPPSAPVNQTGEAAAAVTPHDLVQQLEPVVRDLASVRHSLEQLAAKQDQMAQDIATLQATEQDIRKKMSSPPAPRPAPRKPSQAAVQSSAVQPSSAPSPAPSAQPPLPLH